MTDVFSLEALEARHGDALLLHYGTTAKPRLMVVDGGPPGVWKQSLRPRLEELRTKRGTPLAIERLMVSHVDDDHIRGILDMTAAMERAIDVGDPPPYVLDGLWFNAFDDVIGNVEPALFSRPELVAGLGSAHDSAAVIASVGQGRTLRDRASKLALAVNEGRRLLRGGESVTLGSALQVRVIGPESQRIDEFQKAWDKELKKKGWDKEPKPAEVAAYLDKSVWNLASIVAIVTSGTKTMLLTGDARGDDVISSLENADLLKASGIDFDLMKVPHHGSDRNVTTDFFRRVRAKHYVISGDGEHGNPEPKTLRMIVDARGASDYQVHCTHRVGIKGLGGRLDTFLQGLPPAQREKFRFREENELSLRVDLLSAP